MSQLREQKEYTGKKGFEVLSTERFGLQRKIVANMTTESWESIPHTSAIYEPDVTEFLKTYQRLRQKPEWKGVSINTVMLYVITQGLIACPAMNAHIEFKRGFVNGKIEQYADVNITMPMVLPDGGMMTVNVHNCERKNVRQLQDYIEDIRRRLDNTSMDDALFEVGFHDTMQELKRLKILKAMGRLIGSKVGAGEINKLKGKKKRAYGKLPDEDKLTRKDIEQGTIVVSNVGSIYRGGSYVVPTLLEIIPPQVAAVVFAAAVEKPGVVQKPDGGKSIEPRMFMPMCFAFDHRAADFGDCTPFITRLDEIFNDPGQMESWLSGPARP
ncbi:MAG: 2-oxo acid dehydrogenase subunit E2 [Oscillospiraceae bacterium]|nr:2-oxo acid dehydrogenase subunit E2 [Oscillospiraceae bacterium]